MPLCAYDDQITYSPKMQSLGEFTELCNSIPKKKKEKKKGKKKATKVWIKIRNVFLFRYFSTSEMQ